MRTPRHPQITRVPSVRVQYATVWSMQFSKVRRTWFFHFLIPSLIAFGTVWLGSRLAAVGSFPAVGAERYVTGAIFVAVMFTSVNSVAHDAALAKQLGEIEYLSTFPLSRWTLLLAMLTLPVLYALPSVGVILLAGRWLLHVHPTPGPEFALIIVVTDLMLAGFGTLLGLYLPLRLATTVSAALPLMLMMFSPLLVPPDAFPRWMGVVGRILPTTLAVDVMQTSLFGSMTAAQWVRLAVIAALAVGLVALVVRLPGWRER